jgi:hypothetical protein
MRIGLGTAKVPQITVGVGRMVCIVLTQADDREALESSIFEIYHPGASECGKRHVFSM